MIETIKEPKKVTELQILLNNKIVKLVLELIKLHTGYELKDLNTKSRYTELVMSRQIAIYFIHKNTRYSNRLVCSIFNRDHAIKNHSVKTVENLKDKKGYLGSLFYKIEKEMSSFNNVSYTKILKIKYNAIANNYIEKFKLKQGFHKNDGGWVGNNVGEIYCVADCLLSFNDIRTDIDSNAKKHSIINWYYKNLYKENFMNYKNYLKINK